MKSVVGKVAADQFVFAPALLSGLFYSMARLEGQPHAVGADRVSGTLLPALQMNWTVRVVSCVTSYFVFIETPHKQTNTGGGSIALSYRLSNPSVAAFNRADFSNYFVTNDDDVCTAKLPPPSINQVWPLITAVNQTLVPVAQRVTVVNLVCIPWTAYLAYKNCKAKEEELAAGARERQ